MINNNSSTSQEDLKNLIWGIWSCGHLAQPDEEIKNVVINAHGLETRCNTCHEKVLPWPLPVHDGQWLPNKPSGSKSSYLASEKQGHWLGKMPFVPAIAKKMHAVNSLVIPSFYQAEAKEDHKEAARLARICLTLLPDPDVGEDKISLGQLTHHYDWENKWEQIIEDVNSFRPFCNFLTSGGDAHYETALNRLKITNDEIQNRPKNYYHYGSCIKLDALPTCAFTLQPIFDPVTLSCGHSFEHERIRKYLEIIAKIKYYTGEKQCFCPLCRTEVYPWPTVNLPLRAAIDNYYKEHPLEGPAPQQPRMPPVAMPLDQSIQGLLIEEMNSDVDLEEEIKNLLPIDKLNHVKQALRTKPYHFDWLVLRAKLEQKCGLLEAAQKTWSYVLTRNEFFSEALYQRAVCQIEQKNPSAAFRSLQAWSQRPGFGGREALLFAVVCRHKNLFKMVEEFTTLALNDNDLPAVLRGQAFTERALARLELERFIKACFDLAQFKSLKIPETNDFKSIKNKLITRWGNFNFQILFFWEKFVNRSQSALQSSEHYFPDKSIILYLEG